MSILAIFIDDFACTASWGEASSLDAIHPVGVRPKILFSSQVLLGKTKPGDTEPWDQAVVTGLTEDRDALLERADWAIGGKFESVGLRELLKLADEDKTSVKLAAYFAAASAACLKAVGSAVQVTAIRISVTVCAPKDIKVCEDATKLAAKSWQGSPELHFDGDAFDVAHKVAFDAVQKAARSELDQDHEQRSVGFVSLWREGMTTQISTIDQGKLEKLGSLAPLWSNIPEGKSLSSCFAQALTVPIVDHIHTTLSKPNFYVARGDAELLVSAASDFLVTTRGRNKEEKGDAQKFIKDVTGKVGTTSSTSCIVIIGAPSVSQNLIAGFAPKRNANDDTGISERMLRYLIGPDVKTACVNDHDPLAGVSLVLQGLLEPSSTGTQKQTEPENNPADAVSHFPSRIGKLTLESNGQLDHDLETGEGIRVKLNIIGLPSDGNQEFVLEARSCDDGSWLLTAHLRNRNLRIKLGTSAQANPELRLGTDGCYLLIPNRLEQKRLRALQHLVRDGLVLFHPNSNPLLPDFVVS